MCDELARLGAFVPDPAGLRMAPAGVTAAFGEGATMAYAAPASDPASAPTLLIGRARAKAFSAARAGDWRGARAAIDAVLRMLPHLAGLRPAADDRVRQLAELQDLAGLAVWCAVEGGRDVGEEAVWQAWERLEAIRGVYLGRALAGLGHPGASPTRAQMRQAAAGGAIVSIVDSGLGCCALLLSAAGVGFLPLPRLAETADPFADYLVRDTPGAIPGVYGEPLERIRAWMWRCIAGPVLERLGHTARHTTRPADEAWPRVWWMPTGPLSGLPLHAAAAHPGGPAVLDRVVSSYTVSVRALWNARHRSLAEPGNSTITIGVNGGATSGGEPVSSARAEAESDAVHRLLAAEGWPVARLNGAGATRKAISGALARAALVHLACHVHIDPAAPGDSFLAAHDRALPAREVAGMCCPRGHLAFLSARVTSATAVEDTIDEQIHLAAALQRAGFANVIATLTLVGDEPSAEFAVDVYRLLADGIPPAVALHHVTRARRAGDGFGDWMFYLHYGP